MERIQVLTDRELNIPLRYSSGLAINHQVVEANREEVSESQPAPLYYELGMFVSERIRPASVDSDQKAELLGNIILITGFQGPVRVNRLRSVQYMLRCFRFHLTFTYFILFENFLITVIFESSSASR